ncbi:glycosyltransferase family 2 protein [Marinobacter sp.]|uniref:glycosyltransferase family 2 protein n=1 Tax=Marinobacter sp. TaxID=50741 RepID=UPI000C90DEB7|nr:glycosyltransferase family 2 protein [Marinobacter sp.]MAC24597.1 hypothetical protein [Marinobacter sp.]HAC87611.1 hypothetical protein [Gammaproteobacteria bacterium]|tara:strand:- start:3670 stop:4617 length:948 start_codon:yes stop_codon:yes gene_type:complete
MSAPEVSIVILSYNRKEYLTFNLLELTRIKRVIDIDLEIIVVDNNSYAFDVESIAKDFPSVSIIKLEENQGAVARSVGMRASEGRIIITLDDDVYGLKANQIKWLLEKFYKNENVGAINFKVLDEKTGVIVNWAHHVKKEVYADSEFETYEISEGAVAFRAEVLEIVGYYPMDFFISHEGPDLAIRILNAGYSVMYSPSVEVTHAHASQGRASWRRYYYDSRNVIWLAVRRYPMSLVIRIMLPNLLALFLYSLRDGFVRYYFKGVIDGIAGVKRQWRCREIANSSVLKLVSEVKKKSPPLHRKLRERLFRRGVQI